MRVRTKDGWWLLRASNTQDVLVARCEAAVPSADIATSTRPSMSMSIPSTTCAAANGTMSSCVSPPVASTASASSVCAWLPRYS